MNYRIGQNVLLIATFLILAALVVSLLQQGATTKLPSRTQTVDAATIVKVWVYKRTGLYYCPDSKFYGKFKPGVYMMQDEALGHGYQPAGQEPCR
jgi:hypothetical protein